MSPEPSVPFKKTEGLLEVDILLFAIFEFGTPSTFATWSAVIAG